MLIVFLSHSPQMTEHYWTPQSNVSNETSTNKTFQRTISAQVHTHIQTHGKTVYQHDMTSHQLHHQHYTNTHTVTYL